MISRMPWIVPSSPGRPCSTLSTTSGAVAARTDAISRATSMRDTGMIEHAPTHGLTQRLDVARGCAAQVDQKVAVHRRHLRAADHKTTTTGRVDQLPSLLAWRILEGRSTGAALDRLR